MEEVLPPETRAGSGFESTRVRQFTVFLENRVGRLMALLRALEESETSVHAIAVEESADAALVRLITSDADTAKNFLKQAGFSMSVTEVLVVVMPEGHAHPLQKVCSALLTAELNLHYAYPLFMGTAGPALVLYVDDLTLAARLLIKKGFQLMAESDLRQEDGPAQYE